MCFCLQRCRLLAGKCVFVLMQQLRAGREDLVAAAAAFFFTHRHPESALEKAATGVGGTSLLCIVTTSRMWLRLALCGTPAVMHAPWRLGRAGCQCTRHL